MSLIAPLDRDRLREQYRTAKPFPFLSIDGFLEPTFAAEVASSYPSFDQARALGREFRAVNENRKTQIVDYQRFPDAVKKLADTLGSAEMLRALEDITGIQGLHWDPGFAGGGMHQTASSGWLDVHVDFNYHEELRMHRRLNILVFLNPEWDERWGGLLELWDENVTQRHHALAPILNRCVIFETSEISFHGVTAVVCPDGVVRRSFAAYYYTPEPPVRWSGQHRSTVFRARPNEPLKAYVLMPAERARHAAASGLTSVKGVVKGFLGRRTEAPVPVRPRPVDGRPQDPPATGASRTDPD